MVNILDKRCSLYCAQISKSKVDRKMNLNLKKTSNILLAFTTEKSKHVIFNCQYLFVLTVEFHDRLDLKRRCLTIDFCDFQLSNRKKQNEKQNKLKPIETTFYDF